MQFSFFSINPKVDSGSVAHNSKKNGPVVLNFVRCQA